MLSQQDKKQFIINVLYIAILCALIYFILKYLLVWLMPFVVGFILALFLQPLVGWLLRHTGLQRRFVAPLVTTILIVLLLFLFIFLTVAGINEITSFASGLPDWFQKVLPNVVNTVNEKLEYIISFLPPDWEMQIRSALHDIVIKMQGQVGQISATVLALLANQAAALPGALVSLIITIVATFFICSQLDTIKGFIKRQVPEKYKGLVGDTWITFAVTLRKMISSYLLLMFFTFCQLALGLTLLRIDYAVILAALIAVVDIMPVLGTGTILIPWGLMSLLGGDTGHGVGILLLYIIITVIRNILEPRLIGKRIGLPPLVTLVFMYLGLHVLGIPGMFIFPLLLILLKHAQDSGMVHIWNE